MVTDVTYWSIGTYNVIDQMGSTLTEAALVDSVIITWFSRLLFRSLFPREKLLVWFIKTVDWPIRAVLNALLIKNSIVLKHTIWSCFVNISWNKMKCTSVHLPGSYTNISDNKEGNVATTNFFATLPQFLLHYHIAVISKNTAWWIATFS